MKIAIFVSNRPRENNVVLRINKIVRIELRNENKCIMLYNYNLII